MGFRSTIVGLKRCAYNKKTIGKVFRTRMRFYGSMKFMLSSNTCRWKHDGGYVEGQETKPCCRHGLVWVFIPYAQYRVIVCSRLGPRMKAMSCGVYLGDSTHGKAFECFTDCVQASGPVELGQINRNRIPYIDNWSGGLRRVTSCRIGLPCRRHSIDATRRCCSLPQSRYTADDGRRQALSGIRRRVANSLLRVALRGGLCVITRLHQHFNIFIKYDIIHSIKVGHDVIIYLLLQKKCFTLGREHPSL